MYRRGFPRQGIPRQKHQSWTRQITRFGKRAQTRAVVSVTPGAGGARRAPPCAQRLSSTSSAPCAVQPQPIPVPSHSLPFAGSLSSPLPSANPLCLCANSDDLLFWPPQVPPVCVRGGGGGGGGTQPLAAGCGPRGHAGRRPCPRWRGRGRTAGGRRLPLLLPCCPRLRSRSAQCRPPWAAPRRRLRHMARQPRPAARWRGCTAILTSAPWGCRRVRSLLSAAATINPALWSATTPPSLCASSAALNARSAPVQRPASRPPPRPLIDRATGR